MKIGDLVKTKRASIGAPLGSVGLIIKMQKGGVISASGEDWSIFTLLMSSCKAKQRRYCQLDLEVISDGNQQLIK